MGKHVTCELCGRRVRTGGATYPNHQGIKGKQCRSSGQMISGEFGEPSSNDAD